MSFSPGLAAFKLAFQASPIVLNGGIAASVPGGMLPIISITEALSFTIGLLSGGEDIGLDEFFANFQPLPSATAIDQQIGHYPFANQSVAANAVIAQPLVISLLMICPVREAFGYAAKLATMMALQSALKQHNLLGGTYTIVTPSIFYDNCVMTRMSDVSSQDSKQVQNAWRLDFEQPLLTLQQAQQQLNSMMSKIANGTPTDGSLSGAASTVGSPQTLATPSVAPAASGSVAANTAAPTVTLGNAQWISQ